MPTARHGGDRSLLAQGRAVGGRISGTYRPHGHAVRSASVGDSRAAPLTLEHALLEEMLLDPDATLGSFRATFQRLLLLSRQQAGLLESLLTLADSERGPDHREPMDLSAVAGRVMTASRPELDRRGLRFRGNLAPAGISGDPALVERLVANLLDNAMGYNIPDGWVEVSTGSQAGRAVVSVANTGKTVPAEQVDRLFEPFQRLDRTAGRDGHHGLGLSIVRAIATAHGASIVAHARPDGGLTVKVAFPAYAPSRAGESPERTPARLPSRPAI